MAVTDAQELVTSSDDYCVVTSDSHNVNRATTFEVEFEPKETIRNYKDGAESHAANDSAHDTMANGSVEQQRKLKCCTRSPSQETADKIWREKIKAVKSLGPEPNASIYVFSLEVTEETGA